MKSVGKPWISIAIPSYNRADLLLRTVQSVQNQADQGWEMFIVDDRSTDSAWHVAQMVSHQDSRIHCEQNRENRGLSKNFRYASSKGSAPYLLLLAADDQLEFDFLQRIRQFVTEHEGIPALICGRRVLYYPRYNRYVPYATPFADVYSPGQTVSRALANGNLYGLYSSVVVKRIALNEIEGIPTDNPWAGDYETFVRIAARHFVAFVPQARVYQHADTTTQTSKFLLSGELVNYEIMTLQRLLCDPRVAQHLRPNDIRNAWRRIHALKWSVGLYRVAHGQWRRRDLPAAALPNKMIEASCSVGEIVTTMIRLIYQRWRLTY